MALKMRLRDPSEVPPHRLKNTGQQYCAPPSLDGLADRQKPCWSSCVLRSYSHMLKQLLFLMLCRLLLKFITLMPFLVYCGALPCGCTVAVREGKKVSEWGAAVSKMSKTTMDA